MDIFAKDANACGMNNLPRKKDSRSLVEQQRQWLVDQLKAKGHGARVALAKHLGIRNDAITRMTNLVPEKETREITFEELMGMASFFGASPPGLGGTALQSDSTDTPSNLNDDVDQSLVARHKIANTMSGTIHRPSDSIPMADIIGEARDLPVYGTAQAGKGAMTITQEPVDYIDRPVSLLKVRDAYAIIVDGDSMFPNIRPGWTLSIHPHKKPRTGDYCLFRNEDVDGSVSLCVKEFVRETEDHWHVLQYKPPKRFSFKKSEWQSCHLVVSMNMT